MLFQWSHSHRQHYFTVNSWQFFYCMIFFALDPFYRAIFVQFCVATGLTAVFFTTCMIQHMLSILIYILINLP